MTITLIICTTVLLAVISILIYKYNNTYSEDIVSSTDMTRKSTYSDGSKSQTDYTRVTIKRTYKNGKSVIIIKHL
jgi:hypothetical protein